MIFEVSFDSYTGLFLTFNKIYGDCQPEDVIKTEASSVSDPLFEDFYTTSGVALSKTGSRTPSASVKKKIKEQSE